MDEYKLSAANFDTVTVYENGVPNTISIDRSTAVPGGESQGGTGPQS